MEAFDGQAATFGLGEDPAQRALRDVTRRHSPASFCQPHGVTALARTDGNVAKASELLGVSRPTLYDLMRRLAIQ